MSRDIEYLNTDLLLTSTEDLQPLADAMEQRDAFVLWTGAEDDGMWIAKFEAGGELCVRGPGRDYTPDGHIGWLLDVVESLPAELRDVWTRCESRAFDLGFEGGRRRWGFEQAVSADVLARLAGHRASLLISIYPDCLPPSRQTPRAWRRSLSKRTR